MRIGRVDKIDSFGKLALHLLCLAAYFTLAEHILRYTTFKDTQNDLDYYANIAFSEEEYENAKQFKQDMMSMGNERTSIPGTIIFKYKPIKKESVTINSDGFRNEEFKVKEKDEFRIAIYGDSKIFGFSVKNEDTIPVIIEKQLREHFRRNIKVLNMGIEGYDMQRAIACAEYYNEKLEPDMVVFYSGVIDVRAAFDFGSIDWEPFTGEEGAVPTIALNLNNQIIFDNIKLFNTLKHTYISDKAKLAARMQGGFYATLPIPKKKVVFAEQFPEIFLDRITDASIFFERKGIPSLFILPPLIQYKQPLSDHEQNVLYQTENFSPGISLFTLQCINGVKKRLKTGKYGKNIIDHSEILQGELDTVFFDGMHYTPQALREEAESIAEELVKILEEGNFLEKN